jgi:hypothetical protein
MQVASEPLAQRGADELPPKRVRRPPSACGPFSEGMPKLLAVAGQRAGSPTPTHAERVVPERPRGGFSNGPRMGDPEDRPVLGDAVEWVLGGDLGRRNDLGSPGYARRERRLDLHGFKRARHPRGLAQRVLVGGPAAGLARIGSDIASACRFWSKNARVVGKRHRVIGAGD